MKASTAALQTAFREGYDLRVHPELIAEWEHNRFSTIQSIAVTPAQADDPEWLSFYDLQTVGLPNRPRTGIAKARFSTKVKLTPGYRDQPLASRFYICNDTDPYKYWSSTQKSAATLNNGAYDFATPITLTVTYEDPVIMNKVVVGFETSYSKPSSFTLQVSANGTNWTTVASSPAIDSRGQVAYWIDPFDQWGDTPAYLGGTVIKAVRVIVYSMTSPNSHLDVLQLGARLEHDLTAFIEDYGRSFEISDREKLIAPIGQASSNTAKVTLNNMDFRFNNENESSLYYGLIGKKAKLTLDLVFDVAKFGGSSAERIREFTMWTEVWGGQEQTSVDISLKDSSIFLQEAKMPQVFWEGMTVGAVIWQIMDVIGMTNYSYSRSTLDAGQVVPYYWPDKDDSPWEQITHLAEGTQTAVYFDEYDVMQIKTRNSLYDPTNTIDWNFDAIQNGQKLPDIVELSVDDDVVANTVEIDYKPAKYSDFNNGLPKMETVWEPENDTVVLRASSLVKDLAAADTMMWIKSDEAAYWPYESMVNIRGEILRYKGKEYVWHKPGGGLGYEMVYSQEDKDKVDAQSDEALVWSNSWSGKLAITERGIAGSGTATHKVKPDGYTGVQTHIYNHGFRPWNGGMQYTGGVLTLVGPNQTGDQIYLIKHEGVVTGSTTNYGTRIKFSQQQLAGNNWAVAGLFFAGDWGDAGFYLEISPTEVVEGLENRVWRNEISLVRMPGDAPWVRVDKGATANIVRGVSYDIDVRHTILGNGNAVVGAYLNGVSIGTWTIPSAQKPNNQGKFGLFVRGMCKAEFDYLYAVNQAPETIPDLDASTYLDLTTGGFTSGYIEKEWRYGSYTTVNRGPAHEYGYWFTALNSRANYVLDEYGPVVHEMRNFIASFEEGSVPVIHSYLYMSNQKVACLDYLGNPFGATFTLANASRNNEVINGEDTLTFGSENAVQHKMFVYGRVVYQEDELSLTKKDDKSVRINGTISLTFDNRFIQTEEAAAELGDWVVNQWSGGTDEVTMEVFGNALIQLGDLVTLNYPIKGFYPATHQYYVVGVENSWQDGLETNLILSRSKT